MPDDGSWYHIVLTHNGTTPKLYLNATDVTVYITTNDLTAFLSDAAGLDNARLGCLNFNSEGNTRFFGGTIDAFRYYQNDALTQAEVTALYQEGIARRIMIIQ